MLGVCDPSGMRLGALTLLWSVPVPLSKAPLPALALTLASELRVQPLCQELRDKHWRARKLPGPEPPQASLGPPGAALLGGAPVTEHSTRGRRPRLCSQITPHCCRDAFLYPGLFMQHGSLNSYCGAEGWRPPMSIWQQPEATRKGSRGAVGRQGPGPGTPALGCCLPAPHGASQAGLWPSRFLPGCLVFSSVR